MLRYALTDEGDFVSVEDNAAPPYFCPECLAPLGKKRGPQRIWHFFHYDGEEKQTCNRRVDTHEHRAIQECLLKLLNEKESSWILEHPIPEAKRVADLANPIEKIAIEIQRSPLSFDMLLQRTEAYWKSGWRVVWLVSLTLFRTSMLPYKLQKMGTIPHYFFEEGDPPLLWDILALGKGKAVHRKLASLFVQKRESKETQDHFWKRCIHGKKRSQWTLGIKGDFLDQPPEEHIDCSARSFRLKTALSLLWIRLIGT